MNDPSFEQGILHHLREQLRELTDEERIELFGWFCRYCGRVFKGQYDGCYCMRDD